MSIKIWYFGRLTSSLILFIVTVNAIQTHFPEQNAIMSSKCHRNNDECNSFFKYAERKTLEIESMQALLEQFISKIGKWISISKQRTFRMCSSSTMNASK